MKQMKLIYNEKLKILTSIGLTVVTTDEYIIESEKIF